MKLALIGDPVEHSRSPELQGRFLEEAEIEGTYTAIRVAKGEAVSALHRLREQGYTGVNITTPLKEESLKVCDRLDEDAEMAQAVNTIFFGRKVLGANTDGVGARTALETILGQPVALERIGILGTGATARAIFAQLHETDAYTFVWGRNAEKAEEIRKRFEAAAWPERVPEIVISTLPPGADLPKELVAQLAGADVIMDSNYGTRSTLGRHLSHEVVPGDMMLEAQARASFDFWLAHAQEQAEDLL